MVNNIGCANGLEMCGHEWPPAETLDSIAEIERGKLDEPQDALMAVSTIPEQGQQYAESFERGFVLGQVTTYCEQVITGAKLAAQVGCKRGMVPEVLDCEGCSALQEDWTADRVSIWIFKYPFVRVLISELHKSAPPTAAGVWSMGKLFGYSDAEIGAYLRNNRLG
jgi:hypothetical protein